MLGGRELLSNGSDNTGRDNLSNLLPQSSPNPVDEMPVSQVTVHSVFFKKGNYACLCS